MGNAAPTATPADENAAPLGKPSWDTSRGCAASASTSAPDATLAASTAPAAVARDASLAADAPGASARVTTEDVESAAVLTSRVNDAPVARSARAGAPRTSALPAGASPTNASPASASARRPAEVVTKTTLSTPTEPAATASCCATAAATPACEAQSMGVEPGARGRMTRSTAPATGEGVAEHDPTATFAAAGVVDGDGATVREEEDVGEGVSVAEVVVEGVAVSVGDVDAVLDGVAVGVTVGVTVRVSELVMEPVWDGVMLPVGVALTVVEGVCVCVCEEVPLPVFVAVSVTVGDGVRVSVVVMLDVAVRVVVMLGVTVGEGVLESERICAMSDTLKYTPDDSMVASLEKANRSASELVMRGGGSDPPEYRAISAPPFMSSYTCDLEGERLMVVSTHRVKALRQVPVHLHSNPPTHGEKVRVELGREGDEVDAEVAVQARAPHTRHAVRIRGIVVVHTADGGGVRLVRGGGRVNQCAAFL